jgi:hypothetical protein
MTKEEYEKEQDWINKMSIMKDALFNQINCLNDKIREKDADLNHWMNLAKAKLKIDDSNGSGYYLWVTKEEAKEWINEKYDIGKSNRFKAYLRLKKEFEND